jgi:hypothetical protein
MWKRQSKEEKKENIRRMDMIEFLKEQKRKEKEND